jgi:hypothetical protein
MQLKNRPRWYSSTTQNLILDSTNVANFWKMFSSSRKGGVADQILAIFGIGCPVQYLGTSMRPPALVVEFHQVWDRDKKNSMNHRNPPPRCVPSTLLTTRLVRI